jgi:hypothetical protein
LFLGHILVRHTADCGKRSAEIDVAAAGREGEHVAARIGIPRQEVAGGQVDRRHVIARNRSAAVARNHARELTGQIGGVPDNYDFANGAVRLVCRSRLLLHHRRIRDRRGHQTRHTYGEQRHAFPAKNLHAVSFNGFELDGSAGRREFGEGK